jgi:spermidine/putrescine-binding protein
VKNAPDPELGIAFIDWMLDPTVQQGLAEASLAAPTITGLEFKAGCRKIPCLSRSQDGRDGDLQPGLELHQSNPAKAPRKVQPGIRQLNELRPPSHWGCGS